MPALERHVLQDAAPAGQPERALGGHQAHVGAVGLGLVHRQHGGLAVARHLHAGRLVQEEPRGADLGADLGHRALHERMVAERLGRGALGFGARHLGHVLEGGLPDAQIDRRVAEREALQVDGEVLAGAAHHVGGIDRAVVADGVADGAAHAGGVPGALDLHPRVVVRDHGRDHPVARARLALQDAGDEEVVGRVAQGAELLDPGHPVAAVTGGPEHGVEHELIAEALLGLARDRRDAGAPTDHLAEVAPLLLLGGQGGQEGDHRRVHVEGQRGGRAALGDLAEGVDVGHRIGAHPAVLAWDRERVQAGLVQVGVVLVGERGVRVVPGRARGESLARERGHALHHAALLVGQGREREHGASLALRRGPAQPRGRTRMVL